MTQRQFADLIGITPEYVNKIKAGYAPGHFVCEAIKQHTGGQVVLESSKSLRVKRKAKKAIIENAIKLAVDAYKNQAEQKDPIIR